LIVTICFVTACSKEKSGKVQSPAPAPEHSDTAGAVRESREVAVARVNGVGITARDLVNEMNQITPRFIKPGQKGDPATEEKVKRSALDLLIFRELAEQEALKRGMKAAPEEVTRMIKDLKASLKSEDAFKTYLAKTGMTDAELRTSMEKKVLYSMIIKDEILNRVKLDPQMVEKEYAGNKAAYKGPTGQMTFEEARPVIERKLTGVASGKLVDQWGRDLRKTAKIEIMLDNVGKDIHRAAP
jgi:hypothetical protein